MTSGFEPVPFDDSLLLFFVVGHVEHEAASEVQFMVPHKNVFCVYVLQQFQNT